MTTTRATAGAAPSVTVVGGGLAGCEAAWQLATRGVAVTLVEQKPLRRTPAQTTDALCELVCSNSLRGAALTNAVGLLKEELRRAGSLVLAAADVAAVPAGGALAVDREVFSAEIARRLDEHPLVTRSSAIVERVPDATPDRPVVLATGPLTGDELAADLAAIVGERHLAYYDAIAPVVSADSIDWDRVFVQSRWGKGEAPAGEGATAEDAAAGDGAAASAGGDDAYVNCPFDEAGYRAFVEALVAAEQVEARTFEKVRYFEGCLPVEVMASRGPMTLSFGPMKPVGLEDPRTGRRPYAVVQLRPEDRAKTAYNLVGFQTRMTYAAQLRVLRTIPGLEAAEFLRMGTIHRNTFVNAPVLLEGGLELRARPGVFLAGQMTGVEGYVESAGSGFVCGVTLAQRLLGHAPVRPPETTALGAQLARLSVPHDDFQPSNVTWACFPPLPGAPTKKKLAKHDRYAALAARALADLETWMATAPLASPARLAASA